MKDDRLISLNAAIDAIEFGITYARAINKETGEVKELFQEGNDELRKAVERVKQLPLAQPSISKTEMVGDTISRSAVIEAMAELQGKAASKSELLGISKAWKRIKALPSAQRWILCKTKFPEKDGSYLVTAYNGQMAIYLFVKGMSENYWKQWGATAWMSLPKPWEGEKP